MAEYKDVSELLKQIKDFKKAMYSPSGDYMTGYISALSVVEGMIAGLPAADLVEVVRCKDCKHWHEETGWCVQHSHFIKNEGEFCYPHESANWKMFDGDNYCSDGARKEGAEE